MGTYILKRLLLIIPTLFFILLINFIVVQIAPGGPVEQAIQQAETFQGIGQASGSGGETSDSSSQYQGAKGLSEEMIKKIEAQYGFDKPAHERFWIKCLTLQNFQTLNLVKETIENMFHLQRKPPIKGQMQMLELHSQLQAALK